MITITKILVTDYKEILGSSIVRHLNRQGFTVCGACDIDQAKSSIEVAEKAGQPFGLVISDISRQNRNEVSFIYWLHTHHPAVSVLAISGFGNADLLDALIRPGRDYFRKKPILPMEIVEAIISIEQTRLGQLEQVVIMQDPNERLLLKCLSAEEHFELHKTKEA